MNDLINLAVLKARQDLIDRATSKGPEVGLALFRNQKFQECLDSLDPDMPGYAYMPRHVETTYRLGRLIIALAS